MTVDKLKKEISNNFPTVTFMYNDKDCGIDPLGIHEYDVWCGDEVRTVENLDDVFTIQIFDGKSLSEIIDDITELDY